MIFLLEYDRERGELVTNTAFSNERRRDAERARIELEVRLNSEGVEREVVLLEADDEASLLRSHARYFKTLAELKALQPR